MRGRPQNSRHLLQATGVALDRFLRHRFQGISWNQSRRLISQGMVSVNGTTIRSPTALVMAGDEVSLSRPRAGSPRVTAPECRFVYLDSQLLVVDKPAGISTVPFDEQERDTLWHRVRNHLARQRRSSRAAVLVVHRIDKETSGLIVFARTNLAFRYLKQLFRIHAVERRYIALVHGRITDRTIHTRLVADRGDGRRGSTRNPRLGREAITHVRAIEHFDDASLIECRLETGRTHQIRIHLSEAGHPLLGERVYTAPGLEPVAAPRLMLHAGHLGFQHPISGELKSWSVPLPADMTEALDVLRTKHTLVQKR